ncbi:MAG: N-acetylneuraminate synthase family protein [Bacteroidia bacterium]|nr:N-acetylneuraminate synthase family protein [Bacteroidia bacterium]
MKIGNSFISDNDIYFWVEEGQASLGNFDTAIKYIQTSYEVGANGIEFQLAIPEDLYVSSHPYIEHYKKIQYTTTQIKKLIEYARKLSVNFIATALSKSLIPILAENGCDAFVINASDINNPGIIDPVIESQIPFFISLPLATENEIDWISNRCISKRAKNYVLMHGQHTMASGEQGVMPEDSNLGFISTLKSKYGLPVGYIDHSTSSTMPALARAAGANFISKHLILNKKHQGPDWFVCQEPQEMKATIEYTRKISKSLSVKEKVLAPGEYLDKTVMRRSIVAADYIKKGTSIKREMLAFKRPGTGMPPDQFESLIGLIAIRDILKDDILNLNLFEP